MVLLGWKSGGWNETEVLLFASGAFLAFEISTASEGFVVYLCRSQHLTEVNPEKDRWARRQRWADKMFPFDPEAPKL